MTKLRVGVIGAGVIAQTHLAHLAKRRDVVELVGVADVDMKAAAAAARQYGAARDFGDYREMLPNLDAVLVCAPTFLHRDIVGEALNAGKHVFCEKPLARTMEQGDAIAEAARRSSKTLQIGFVRRFDAEWLAWREAVVSGKIGTPVVWRDMQSWHGPPSPWFGQDELGGGPFLDGCIHNIDFALACFGPAQWAFCHGRTFRESNTAIDTGTATVRFTSGHELMLAWSWGLPMNCNSARVFEFLGPQGTVTWPRDETDDATEGHFVINTGGKQEIIAFPRDALARAYAAQMDEFILSANGQVSPRVGIEAGLQSLRVALAILESGRSGEVVQL